jgi:hypothetical protein
MTISRAVVRPKSSDKTPLPVLGMYELGGGAVVEELCYAINGDPLQIRREGDDVNVIF